MQYLIIFSIVYFLHLSNKEIGIWINSKIPIKELQYCDFCLSFWLSLVINTIIHITNNELNLLVLIVTIGYSFLFAMVVDFVTLYVLENIKTLTNTLNIKYDQQKYNLKIQEDEIFRK